jgi:hypothetical protein
MTKNIFKSWTFWFGLLQIMYGGIGILSGNMDPSQGYTLLITGLGTIGFRLKTNTGVTLN